MTRIETKRRSAETNRPIPETTADIPKAPPHIPETAESIPDPPDVEAWRAKAQAAELPASLVDWLVMHDADAELWADAIGSWTASGRWSSPDRGCKWGE